MPDEREVTLEQPEENVIEVGGQKFKSVDELVAAYSALKETVGRQGAELGELRNAILKMSEAKKPEPEEVEKKGVELEGWEDLLYNDPNKAAEKLLEVAVEKVKKEVLPNAKKELDAEIAEREAWNAFFADYPYLRVNEDFVKDIAYKYVIPSPEFGKLKGKERHEFLAKKIEEHLSGLEKWKELKGKSKYDVGSGASVAKEKKKQEYKPKSFVEQLKELQSSSK